MEEIFDDVVTYLGDDYSCGQEALLRLLIKNAVREVCARRYPYGYTDEDREKAITKYYSVIFNIAVYLYGKQGVEGETNHSENGTSRTYESGGIPDSFLSSIVPVVKII